jgi:hypothetical protein
LKTTKYHLLYKVISFEFVINFQLSRIKLTRYILFIFAVNLSTTLLKLYFKYITFQLEIKSIPSEIVGLSLAKKIKKVAKE